MILSYVIVISSLLDAGIKPDQKLSRLSRIRGNINVAKKKPICIYDIIIRDLIAGMSLEESKAKFTRDSISARDAKTKAIRVYKIEKILRDFYLAPDRSHDLSKLWIYIEKHFAD